MIKLGTNLLSQTVQRNLGRATQDLSKASERLSSGQRINRASDDAAGLAISMSLDKDRRLATTAQRNVSDGISMVSIMSAGLKSQKEILFRMAELAEQSANGTYSSQQREVLQKEYSSLMDEFDRVADATEFNGVKLLRNATPQTIQFMAGITGADTSLLQVAAANSHRYTGIVGLRSDYNQDNLVDAVDISAIFNKQFDPLRRDSYTNADRTQGTAVIYAKDSLGSEVKIQLMSTSVLTRPHNFLNPLPGPLDPPAQLDMWLVATRSNGEQFSSQTRYDTVSNGLALSINFASSGASVQSSIDLSGITYQSLDAGVTVSQTNIGFTSIDSRTAARQATDAIAGRIDLLSTLEGQYGAMESRLSVAHNLLATSGENFAAAASRIKDADIANEAATSVRSGILQQAATSLLAQANQAPKISLSLLAGV